MSTNLLLESNDTPVIWRGPVLAGMIKQFWSDVMWEMLIICLLICLQEQEMFHLQFFNHFH